MGKKSQVIDKQGYRHNIGIILCNQLDELFWARRIGENAWQFPQGGIAANESLEHALYRELNEEIGLTINDVEILASTNKWLHYELPSQYVDHTRLPLCIGQKQIWVMLRLISDEKNVCLTKSNHPEFDDWRWIKYWDPVEQVVSFKRNVYQHALTELESCIQTGSNSCFTQHSSLMQHIVVAND